MKTNTNQFLLLAGLFTWIALTVPQSNAAQAVRDKLEILPEIDGALDIAVFDLNNRGEAVGIYLDADFILRGFLYANGAYTILDMYPSKINNRGQVIGSGFNHDFINVNYVYEKGIYTAIEGFPAAVENSTLVTGLNDRGFFQ